MNRKIKFAMISASLLLMATPLTRLSASFYTDSNSIVKASTNNQTEAVSRAILIQLNNLRGQNGLNPVSSVSVLATMAQDRANHLSNIGKLDGHAGYYYSVGAPYTAIAGENIGYWYNSSINDPNKIAKQIITDLYNDSGVSTYGHRKNMLNPYFEHVGIGVSINPSNGYIYYAQDFGTTSDELGNNWQAASAYAQYTSSEGLSSQYPSAYNQNSDTDIDFSSSEIFSGATKINSVVTASKQTPLYSAPTGGKKSNRALAANTAWYTDQVYTDTYGNNWYRVSTYEWAPINQASIRNL